MVNNISSEISVTSKSANLTLNVAPGENHISVIINPACSHATIFFNDLNEIEQFANNLIQQVNIAKKS